MAAAALRPSGYVYVDNDHMEGDLDESWRKPGVSGGFPTGVCAESRRSLRSIALRSVLRI